MSHQLSLSPAESEFAFRYLAPADASLNRAPLDAVEADHHLDPKAARGLGLAPDKPLEPLFRPCVVDCPIPDEPADRLVSALLAVHCPARSTPYSAYGVHASHPSPRAYYPLRHVVDAPGEDFPRWIDTEDLRGVALPGRDSAKGTAHPTLHVRVDFTVYAPLYNLFRKSLFALECGHFLGELLPLGEDLGLALRVSIDPTSVSVIVDGSSEPVRADALRTHASFARDRNSGRVRRSLFPAHHRFDSGQLGRFIGALRVGLASSRHHFPSVGRCNITPKLCLPPDQRSRGSIVTVLAEETHARDADRPIEALQALFAYPEFGFSTSPGVVFLCIDRESLFGDPGHFIQANAALGFIAQQVIRFAHGEGLFARPFRSYDQHGVDQLLGNPAEGRLAYYGLLIGKNRGQEPSGVLR